MDIFLLFLRLGATAFGGPAAHIAIMHDEVVKRRRWLDEERFMDLIGITNLIPGPNSTEMAIHLGLLRGGWAGLLAAGLGFILPAFTIVLGFAWAYGAFGTLPQLAWLLYGIKPVVIAIILQAIWLLGRGTLRDPARWLIALGVFGASFLGMNEILLLFGGGLLYLAFTERRRPGAALAFLPAAALPGLPVTSGAPISLTALFLSFLKIGSVLYGSGYVLLAFLRAEFVVRLGWLAVQQLLDAVIVGQFTPGPFFTTATFIGYGLGGLPGAVLATLGIFLPSFVFVALSQRLLRRWQDAPPVRRTLNGINAASLGLMAAVTVQMGFVSLVDPLSLIIGTAALFLLLRLRINSTWLILGGGALGLLRGFLPV